VAMRPSFISMSLMPLPRRGRTADTKPIAVAFSLAGLYLHVEKGFSGRQVQRAHMQLARRRKRTWPTFRASRRQRRRQRPRCDEKFRRAQREMRPSTKWCASVWSACAANRVGPIVEFLKPYGLALVGMSLIRNHLRRLPDHGLDVRASSGARASPVGSRHAGAHQPASSTGNPEKARGRRQKR
jgi:hypothetical protein